MSQYIETLAMIELIVTEHPLHLVIIGGDLNCELKGDSPFDPLWQDFIARNSFAYCSDRFSGPGYTYHHTSLGHKKFNDHFLVSKTALESGICRDFKILEDGDNTSDHLPITLTISAQIQAFDTIKTESKTESKLNWNKLNCQHLEA